LYWRMFRRFVMQEMPRGGFDHFAATRSVIEAFLSLRESNSSVHAQLVWLGYRRAEIPYHRAPRAHGKSGWTFQGRVRLFSNSIFAFTGLPVTLILLAGAVGAVGSTLLSLLVFIGWASGAIAVQGYTALMLTILFTGGTTLLALGIVGSYVWRTYENTKMRPESLVREVAHFD